jgi:copper transport protein
MTRSLPRTDRAGILPLLIAAVLATQAASFAAPAVVRGHSILLDADPAPNSVIPASPSQLSLFFSEAVDPRSISIEVVNSEQHPVVGVGAPSVDSTGQVVRATLPKLDPDTYTVEYSVVSAVDGHPSASLYAFVLDPTGTEPPPGLPLPSDAAAPPDPVAVAARWLTTVAGLLLLGAVMVWLFHRRWIGAEDRVPVPWVPLAALAGIGSVALVGYVARSAAGAFSHGHGQPAGLPFDPLAPFGWTAFAIAMRIALIGLVVAGVVAATAGSSAGRRRLMVVGGATVVALFGMSLTGHAAALGGPIWAMVDAAHLIAIAAWLGALPALAVLARRSGTGRAAFAVHARVALVAAPLVILTGLANSPLVVDDSRELVASGYGNLLLAKTLLVSVAVGLGSASYFLARGGGRRRLAAVAGGEVVVAIMAVVVGVSMVSIQPATDRPPSTVDPRLGVAHVYGEGGGSSVHGIVDLPEPGVQSYSFSVADPETGAGREDVAEVTVTFVPPAGSGLVSNTELAEPTQQPWIWTLRGAFTPVVGNWELEIAVHRGRLVEDRMKMPLAVRQVLQSTPLPPATTGSQILGVVAAPTAGLPAGAAGWIVPILLLGGGAVALAVERAQSSGSVRGRRLIRGIRVAVLGAAVVIGVSLVARDLVAAANRAPDEWAEAANPLADDPDAAAAGEELYRANCQSCHGPEGAGDGPAADDLSRPPADLAAIVPDRLDGELGWTIAAGVAGTQMPAFGTTLLDGERWELVSYLRSRWPLAAGDDAP